MILDFYQYKSKAVWKYYKGKGRSRVIEFITCGNPSLIGLLESQKRRSSVGSTGLFWPFQLYFETLHSNLEPIHGLDRGLSAIGIIKADKSYMIGGKNNNKVFFQFLCNMPHYEIMI